MVVQFFSEKVKNYQIVLNYQANMFVTMDPPKLAKSINKYQGALGNQTNYYLFVDLSFFLHHMTLNAINFNCC